MKKILIFFLIYIILLSNFCFAQENNESLDYANDITFYINFKDQNKKPYCVNVDVGSMLTVTEPISRGNKSCGIKPIDYEVIVETDNKYSILPKTNKVLKDESFTDPIFALKIGIQITGLLFQMLTGNFNPEKVY